VKFKLQSENNIWQLYIKCRIKITDFLLLLAKWILPRYEDVVKEQEKLGLEASEVETEVQAEQWFNEVKAKKGE